MPKIDLDGWTLDRTRREAREAKGLCPMCGKPKRAEDKYDCDDCKSQDAAGAPSKE